MKKEKKIIIIVIALSLIILIGGGSYAWFNYYQVSDVSNILVAGDIRMTLEEGMDTVTLTNVFPETKEEARSHGGNTLTFEVNGANTSNKAIVYNILLNKGTSKDGKIRFQDNELKFDLVEIINNEEVYLVENANFDTLSNTSIYDNIVPGSTNSVSHTYKLRVWVNESVIISETETGNHVYTPSEYKDLYATVKIAVKGETVEGETKTVTFDADGGVVPVSTKNVIVGNNYGYLPTPTKEGYTFLGWNGKNKFSGLIKGKSLNDTTGADRTLEGHSVTDFINVNMQNNTYYLSGLSSDLRTYVAAYNGNNEDLYGTVTISDTGWYVLERVDKNTVMILYK